jgi:hypothetical protein
MESKALTVALNMVDTITEDLAGSKSIYRRLQTQNHDLEVALLKLRPKVTERDDRIALLESALLDIRTQHSEELAEVKKDAAEKIEFCETEIRRLTANSNQLATAKKLAEQRLLLEKSSRNRDVEEKKDKTLRQLPIVDERIDNKSRLASITMAGAESAKIMELNVEVVNLRRENTDLKQRLQDNSSYVKSLERAHEEMVENVRDLERRLALATESNTKIISDTVRSMSRVNNASKGTAATATTTTGIRFGVGDRDGAVELPSGFLSPP